MAGGPVVDVHVHVSGSAAIGAWGKAAYEIWEYGDKPDVQFSAAAGDLEDLRRAMRDQRVDHAVVVNAFSIDEWRGLTLAGLVDARASLATELVRFNEWLVDAVAQVAELTPFVAVDPWLLSVGQIVDHLDDMRRRGARGVKIHPIDQRFPVADPRMLRVFRACAELDLTVLAHSGPCRTGAQVAEPRAFAEVATAVPGLRLVVAHLGGASWRQVPDLAVAHPQVLFDLSEIIAWLGAPRAPSATDLVRLVRDVGVDRVLFGSDFPWYNPGEMVRAVDDLPGLSTMERAAILGGNAATLLSLPL